MLERVATEDTNIHSFLAEADRRKRVLGEAQHLLKLYPDPQVRPPLFGIPVGVKDLFSVDGLPTQAGSKLPFQAFTAPQAHLVTKLKQLGAIVLGKTVSTEFAYFSPGPTRNPVNLKYSPGGSSSGSAAAVAQGLCPLALGTQTIASINRPAAYCGIWGFKPSWGKTSTIGVFPFSQSVDQVGFFTSQLEDVAYIAQLLGETIQPEPKTLKLRILVPQGTYLKQADQEYQDYFSTILTHLDKGSYEIVEFELFENIEQLNYLHNRLIAAEFARNHHKLYAKYQDLYSLASRDLYEYGSTIKDHELKHLQTLPKLLRDRIHAALIENKANLILTPGATSCAPLGLESTGSPLMSLPFTHAGLPTISLPYGQNSKYLPLSLQLIASFSDDGFLINATKKVYQALPNIR